MKLSENDRDESMRKKCIKCKGKIVERPFYKLRDSNGAAEVYLCAPCIREWMHSWPKLPEGDKNEQMRLAVPT